MPAGALPPQVDTTKPSIARVYDAFLGGKDNFEVDREVCAKLVEFNPDAPYLAQDNRRWVRRVVRWLTSEAGVDQFLDLGSGLPTVENTHEVAQRVNPDTVVVYVDNDPAVIAHGRALLEGDPNTFFFGGDLTDPAALLADPGVARHLDFDRPVAVLQCLTLHHVADQAEAEAIVAGYLRPLASGSYLALTHNRLPEPSDERRDRFMDFVRKYREASPGYTPRLLKDIQALVAGLDLVEPGLVPVDDWWPEGPQASAPRDLAEFVCGGVARKP